MFMILPLLLRMPRFREVKPLACGHTARRRHSWELNPVNSASNRCPSSVGKLRETTGF